MESSSMYKLNVRSLWVKQDDLDKLPWKSGKVPWIFADEAEKLAEKLRGKGGGLRIGDYVYGFRCNQKFIVRLPAKHRSRTKQLRG